MNKVLKSIGMIMAVVVMLAVLPVQLSNLQAENRVSKAPASLQERLNTAVVLFLGSSNSYVNGKIVKIDPGSKEICPVIKNGRTLVPVRFIAENTGSGVQWDAQTKTVSITSGGKVIRMTLGSRSIMVNGRETTLDVAAELIGGRVFVPLRGLVNALEKKIFWDSRGLIVISDMENIIDAAAEHEAVEKLAATFEPPINYRDVWVDTSMGGKMVKVIKVNPKDPDISFEVNIPNTKLNNTADFGAMAANKGAFAAVNGNFFSSFDPVKDPIGNVLVNGRLVYGQSGLTTIGMTYDKDIVFSQPSTFINGWVGGRKENVMRPDGSYDYYKWTVYEINVRAQTPDSAVMYTPERGQTVDITTTGYVITVENSIVTGNYHVDVPGPVAIPAKGYVIFFGDNNANQWHGHEALKLWNTVEYEYHLFANTNKEFDWKKMQWAVAGGPDLVVNWEKAPPTTNPGFADERFTTRSAIRTAAGITKNGHLLLVSVPSATIAEMKEIMQSLGCKEAVNLDGGASSGMYYNGKVLVKPGRQLVTMLYVYKK